MRVWGISCQCPPGPTVRGSGPRRGLLLHSGHCSSEECGPLLPEQIFFKKSWKFRFVYEPLDSKRLQVIHVLAKTFSRITPVGKNKSQAGRLCWYGPHDLQPACLLSLFPHQISLRHINQNFWGLSSSQDTFWIFLILKDSSLAPLLFFGIFSVLG